MNVSARHACAAVVSLCCALEAWAATFTVTNTADSGAGTLRQAIEDAHANGATPDTINFNIGGTPPFTITLQTSLRSLSFPNYEIRADTQPGYATGVPAIYLVPAAGSGAQTQPVFASSTSNCVIRGFHISGFTNVSAVSLGGYGYNKVTANILVHNGNGVYISGGVSNLIGGAVVGDRNVISSNTDIGVRFEGGTNCLVAGNFIGTDTNGVLSWPNRLSGITLVNAWSNTIRGTPAAPQVISGNGSAGISMSGANAKGNVVLGNFIGTDVTGLQRLPNDISGITMDTCVGNTIGGTNAGERNLLSGNDEYGIRLTSGAYSNTIMANLIGLASNGVTVLSNRFDGIRLLDSPSNTIGGAGRGNYIGGNSGNGVLIDGTGSTANVVHGNIIGMGPSSNAAPNGHFGIYVWEARANSVGGTGAGQGNVVVHGATDGIYVRGSNAIGNIIAANLVGVDDAGTDRGNASSGVRVDGGVSNLIGATVAGGRNIISGNNASGVHLHDGAQGNRIYGNYIGLNPAGTAAVSNSAYGVRLDDAYDTAVGAFIGGNRISGNAFIGVYVSAGASNTTIRGNYIGTSAIGTNRVPNGGDGIYALAPGLRIGGTLGGEGNLIAGNAGNGVNLVQADNVSVLGNTFGLDILGRYAVSNGQHGLWVTDCRNLQVGNGTSSGRNIISGSRLTGIRIAGVCSNAVMLGNYIGTGAAATNAVENNSGIHIDSDYVTVGGTNSGDRNVISGNGVEGVLVSSGRFVNILGNYIGVGADGTTSIANYYGVRLQSATRGVQVGGTNAGARNVVARNTGHEVWIEGPAGGHSVAGNYIGLSFAGAAYGGLSGGSLIRLDHSPSNAIRDNAMGSSMEGVEIFGTGSFANVVAGNKIGTDATGTDPAGMLRWAVQVRDAFSNRIGGAAAELNVIAHSGGGILVTNSGGPVSHGNLLAPNLVFSNKPDLNIDLGGEGFTANDAGDGDSGPNHLQNRPTLTNGFILGSLVYAQGVLTSAPSQTFLVDIFRADGTNAGSRIHLGRVPVTTDGGGVAAFTAGFPISLAAGTYLSATATGPGDNTSEFAASPAGLVAGGGDSDGDLIPDFWENLYGLNPAASNGPSDDADSDGYTDLAEYIADTAANYNGAYPFISAISNGPARNVTFPSSGARVYSLQYNDALGWTSSWLQAGGSITGQYGSSTIADASNVPTRAYRLGVKLP